MERLTQIAIIVQYILIVPIAAYAVYLLIRSIKAKKAGLPPARMKTIDWIFAAVMLIFLACESILMWSRGKGRKAITAIWIFLVIFNLYILIRNIIRKK